MLTMSALPRLLNCTGAALLQRAENASFWADAGNDEHEDLAVLDALPPHLAKLVPAGARAEVKVAYDCVNRTARIIGEGSDRGYGALAPFEIAGSIDVLATVDDAAFVLDWKTGYRDVDPAESNWQLWGYALAACTALRLDRAIVRIVYTKSGRVDTYEIDALELATFADRLARLQERVAVLQLSKDKEPVATREGTWCRHCASKHACPSKNALLVQLGTKGLAASSQSVMTPELAADAVRQFQLVEQLVDDARKRLVAYVDEHGPIDLGDGKAYGRHTRPGKERLDGAITLRAVRELAASMDDDAAKVFEREAIKPTTSKAAIDRAAKAIGKPSQFAKDVIARVRALNGITKLAEERPVGEFPIGAVQPAPPPEFPIGAVNELLAKVPA